MKNFLQGLGFIIIVIGGFWVGMQWGSIGNTPTPTPTIDYQHVPVTPTPSEPETPAPEVPAEVPVTPEVIPLPDSQPDMTPTPSTTATPVDIPAPKNDKVIHYQSSYFKYGFDIPAHVYYSAFGAENGAQHTVGIAKEDPATLADAAIRVYFYGKKIVPELQNATKVTDPAGKFIYLLLNNQYSVKIEASDVNNPIVQTIVQTIAVQ